MRDFLANLPTEPIIIIKPDGTEISVPQALVDPASKLITISDATLNIEENDIISRTLPNGHDESFIVVDRGFVRGMGGITDHFQVKVTRKTNSQSIYPAHSVATYNIGNAQKVNINSIDNSVAFSVTKNEKELFEKLLILAEGLTEKEQVKTKIVELEGSVGTATFIEKYNNFIQSIANHMTIFAPFIPLLSNLLIK